MKRLLFAMAALSLIAGVAAAQTTPTDTTVAQPPATTAEPPPATTPAPPPPPPPPPAQSQPTSYRWGGLGGLYTVPQGDFDGTAGEGWGILISAEQFVNPSMMIAVTSDAGYLDFGSKTTTGTRTDFSMFPVQAGLRLYPTAQRNPDSKVKLFAEGALGFYTTRSEVEVFGVASSNYDYYFGTNAGAGVKLATNPRIALLFDATWNWVFATGTDPNFLALRGALMVPVGRR